jgi:hypothetical protein
MRAPQRPESNIAELIARKEAERRRQIRGLLMLGAFLLMFILLRAGLHNVFPRGWWRVW